MNEPYILVENFFSSPAQFPGHMVAADEEASGHELWHVADGRRILSDYYASSTANQARTLTVACDRIRAADMLVLDRGHNLAGAAITVLGSDDNFTTSRTVWSGTIPTVTAPGSLDEANGVVTEEGAFLVRFTREAWAYWRVGIPALGSGIVPAIVGLWLGMSWQMDFLDNPFAEDQAEQITIEQSSDAGWLARSAITPRRHGTLPLTLRDDQSYELARYHLQGHWINRNRPMWLVMDSGQADRAVLTLPDRSAPGFAYVSGAAWRQAQLPWIEHEPLGLT